VMPFISNSVVINRDFLLDHSIILMPLCGSKRVTIIGIKTVQNHELR